MTTPAAAFLAPSLPAPNRGGRPTAYCPELITRILATVREEGLSPTAATEKSGISRGTLSRWRRQYPNFEMRLQFARTEYRRVRLGQVRPRSTADGRPNWRTAARELEFAFPEEYSMNPARRAAFRAQRDFEQTEWERACAEFAREKAGHELKKLGSESFENHPSVTQGPTEAAPSLQKLQNLVLSHPAPSETPVHSRADLLQKFQNPSLLAPSASAPTPSPASPKFRNPISAPAHVTAPRLPSPGDPYQKFQNPSPMSSPGSASVTPTCQNFQNPTVGHRQSSDAQLSEVPPPVQKFQNLTGSSQSPLPHASVSCILTGKSFKTLGSRTNPLVTSFHHTPPTNPEKFQKLPANSPNCRAYSPSLCSESSSALPLGGMCRPFRADHLSSVSQGGALGWLMPGRWPEELCRGNSTQIDRWSQGYSAEFCSKGRGREDR